MSKGAMGSWGGETSEAFVVQKNTDAKSTGTFCKIKI